MRTDELQDTTTHRMANEVECRVARFPADRATVLRLRDIVYVRDQDRLLDSGDMQSTFDRYDNSAVYILAESANEAVGTVKLIVDSDAGLPCECVVDLSGLRPGNRLVEIGHLMTVPDVRNQRVGLRLMGEAFRYSIDRFGATHLLGDFFVDEGGKLMSFCSALGFRPLCEPYNDARFKNKPRSVVAAVDVAQAREQSKSATGRLKALYDFFLIGATSNALG